MKIRFVYFVAAAALALAACAPVKKDDGAAVEARAAARWDLLIKHEAEKAYDYLTPGFRQTITREKYAGQKNDVALRWKAARVAGHQCDADTCTVTVMVDTEVKMPGVPQMQKASAPVTEHWIRVDREWYFLPDTRIKAVPVEGQGPGADAARPPQKPQS